MALRAKKSGGAWGVFSGERFGHYGPGSVSKSAVWVHAVSLGETRAAHPLLRALLDQGQAVLLTHMTSTGQMEACRAFADEIQQGQLVQQWLPYDFPGATRRFMAHYQPRVGILIEREVWPNLLAAAASARVPMVLASARFSDQALRQSLRLGSVMRKAYASFYAVYAQTLHDAQRLEQAGAQAVRVSGNFKFDVTVPAEHVQRGHAFAAALPRKMLTIASTREGEDELFIQAISKQLKRAQLQGKDLSQDVLFCLIPRHPQRFALAAELLSKANLPFIQRSAVVEKGDSTDLAARMCADAVVLLGNTLGEMPRYYAASQVAIVAGSFQPLGGQNFIEACAVGVPVVVGPHTRNFQQAVVDAIDEGAALRAADADAAVQLALQLLEDPQRLARMAEAGAHWVQKHTGAVARVMSSLDTLPTR